MRVLHVVEPFSSGITTFIIGITNAIPTYEHIVLHGGRATSDEQEAVKNRFDTRVSFIFWRHAQRSLNPIKDLLALIQLIRVIGKGSYDIVHLHSAKAGFLGRLACWLLRRNSVIYTPNSAPFARTDIGQSRRRFYEILEKIGAKLCGKIITCGPSEHQLYKDSGIYTEYINNGIIINGNKEAFQQKKESNICVGFMGIATYQKAPELFNSIAKSFLNEDQVRFKWVGDGPLAHLIKSPNVAITGWLKNSKLVNEQLATIDIYLSTAQWEGQPFAVIEAMRDKKCLVLFDCVGNRDLVSNGDNGYLFSNKNDAVHRLKELLANPALIKKMGSRSREIFEKNHDIANTATKYIDVYEGMVKK